MDFLEFAKKRCSIRKYQDKKVESDKLIAILESARIAPTAHNVQPQKILVVQSEEGLAKLMKGSNTYGASLALIVCSDHEKTWKRLHDGKDSADIDASIAASYMMLEATGLGLGSVWVGNFNPAILRDEFNIPETIEPITILLVGYAIDENLLSSERAIKRKNLTETITYESF